MKNIKSISKEANELRVRFQQTIVKDFIKRNGSIGGYKGQLYILLPKYDQRTPLYKGVPKAIYSELHDYLMVNQSQRRFSKYNFFNDLDIVRSFIEKDHSICFYRVWHNGVSVYSGKHFYAQAAALYQGIDKFGFTYYENDYNFQRDSYLKIKTADPLLVSIYTRILERKMAEINVRHEN